MMPLCWTTDNTRPAEAAGGKFARGGQTLFFTNVQTKFSVKDPSKDSSWMILFIHDESDVKISQLYGRCHQLSSAAYAGPQSQCQSVGARRTLWRRFGTLSRLASQGQDSPHYHVHGGRGNTVKNWLISRVQSTIMFV